MQNLPDIIGGSIFIILGIAGTVAMFFMDPAPKFFLSEHQQ